MYDRYCSFKQSFELIIREAGAEYNSHKDRIRVYSLRHTYATFCLQEGVNHYVLARNMGTSVKMLEQHYGHTSNRAMADELTKHKDKKREKLLWEQISYTLEYKAELILRSNQ